MLDLRRSCVSRF